jgi:hypothetical protein
MSANCCGHDALDWLAAIGPTIATFAAAGVAWVVYRSDARARRELSRPMLVFKESLNPTGLSMRWRLELRNHGQSLADIRQISISVEGKEQKPSRLQQPNPFWDKTLSTLGEVYVASITGNLIFAPFSIGAGFEQLIFDALLEGEEPKIASALVKLNIKVTYESPLGDVYTQSLRRAGSTDALPEPSK